MVRTFIVAVASAGGAALFSGLQPDQFLHRAMVPRTSCPDDGEQPRCWPSSTMRKRSSGRNTLPRTLPDISSPRKDCSPESQPKLQQKLQEFCRQYVLGNVRVYDNRARPTADAGNAVSSSSHQYFHKAPGRPGAPRPAGIPCSARLSNRCLE